MKEQVTNLTAEGAKKDATIAHNEIVPKKKDAEIESLRRQLQTLKTQKTILRASMNVLFFHFYSCQNQLITPFTQGLNKRTISF